MKSTRCRIDDLCISDEFKELLLDFASRLDALERAVAAKEPKAEAEPPRCVLCGESGGELFRVDYKTTANHKHQFINLDAGAIIHGHHEVRPNYEYVLAKDIPGAVPVGE